MDQRELAGRPNILARIGSPGGSEILARHKLYGQKWHIFRPSALAAGLAFLFLGISPFASAQQIIEMEGPAVFSNIRDNQGTVIGTISGVEEGGQKIYYVADGSMDYFTGKIRYKASTNSLPERLSKRFEVSKPHRRNSATRRLVTIRYLRLRSHS